MKLPSPFVLVFAVLAMACNKKPHEEAPTEPSPIEAPTAAVSPPPETPAPVAAAIEDPELEVPADFADEAAEEVTPQNLENELAALEKEINNDT